MVPVLSRTTVLTRPTVSSAADVLKRIPCRAPTPFATMMATGVASPSAQGQLMTSTAIPLASAKPVSAPTRSHTRVATAAMAITTGTNMPATLSAILDMGALVAEASLTIRIIWESVVSSPTRVARHSRKPDRLTVAEATLSPAALSTGMLSPVRADSSTAEAPLSTIPSTGTDDPGFTTNTSPTCTWSMGTNFS